MEELLNKLFDKLEDAKMYSPTYSYDVKIANQTIRSFFEDELSKFCQHDVSSSLDLQELERKLDEKLDKETCESLKEWLRKQRQCLLTV